jgi:hypothetical protein
MSVAGTSRRKQPMRALREPVRGRLRRRSATPLSIDRKHHACRLLEQQKDPKKPCLSRVHRVPLHVRDGALTMIGLAFMLQPSHGHKSGVPQHGNDIRPAIANPRLVTAIGKLGNQAFRPAICRSHRVFLLAASYHRRSGIGGSHIEASVPAAPHRIKWRGDTHEASC